MIRLGRHSCFALDADALREPGPGSSRACAADFDNGWGRSDRRRAMRPDPRGVTESFRAEHRAQACTSRKFQRKAATRRTHRFMFYANLDYFHFTYLPEVPTRACASPRKTRPARVLVGRARVSKNPCNVSKFFEAVPYLDNEPLPSEALRLGTRRWRSSTPSLRKRSRRFIDFMHTA